MIYFYVISPGTPQPILEEDGHTKANSISTIDAIEIGGARQYLIIRGHDKAAPVLLYLHGGPGSSEFPLMKVYNPAIEKDFVVAYWEQRGAGKSFSKDQQYKKLNLKQFVSDTREVTEYLRKTFSKRKIYVLGHSWGSLVGILTAHQSPELFHAYFGVGQVVDQYKAEKISLSWAQLQAEEEDDNIAQKKLKENKFPDKNDNIEVWKKYLIPEREYVTKFGGGMLHEVRSIFPIAKHILNCREYSVADKRNYLKASISSLDNLWLDAVNTSLFDHIDSLQVPAYFFQGTYDFQTPTILVKDYYDGLKAPAKDFFLFKDAAHSPMLENPQKFNKIIREIMLGHKAFN